MLSRTIDVQSHAGGRDGNAFKVGTVRALLQKQCGTIALGACRLNPIHPIRNLDIGLLRGRITDLELVLHTMLTIRKETHLGNFGRHGQTEEDLFKSIADGHTPIRLDPWNLPTNPRQANRRRLVNRQSPKLSQQFQRGHQVPQRFLGQPIGSCGSPERSLGVANQAIGGSRNLRRMKPNDFFGMNGFQHSGALRQRNTSRRNRKFRNGRHGKDQTLRHFHTQNPLLPEGTLGKSQRPQRIPIFTRNTRFNLRSRCAFLRRLGLHEFGQCGLCIGSLGQAKEHSFPIPRILVGILRQFHFDFQKEFVRVTFQDGTQSLTHCVNGIIHQQ